SGVDLKDRGVGDALAEGVDVASPSRHPAERMDRTTANLQIAADAHRIEENYSVTVVFVQALLERARRGGLLRQRFTLLLGFWGRLLRLRGRERSCVTVAFVQALLERARRGGLLRQRFTLLLGFWGRLLRLRERERACRRAVDYYCGESEKADDRQIGRAS